MNTKQLLQRVRDVCRVRHLSIVTEDNYRGWIVRYARELPKMPADWASEKKMEAYLTRLAHRGVSRSTQHQAFCALLFLYRDVLKQKLGDINALRPKRVAHVRHAPSRDEVAGLLKEIRDIGSYPTRLVVWLLYGCGLRVSEPLNLRIKDLRLSESRLVIRGANGGKDRVVKIPCSLMPALQAQVKAARVQWERMVERGGVPVEVPGLLARKYPRAPLSWQWFWLFPAQTACQHPRTGETVLWRMHECNVQRCVKAAAARAGLEGSITPHNLRHSFATHVLDAGGNIRDLQVTLGHAHLETTMGYVHAEADRVRSPLDVLSPMVLLPA